MAAGIEHAHAERGDADEPDVGEHHAQELEHELRLAVAQVEAQGQRVGGEQREPKPGETRAGGDDGATGGSERLREARPQGERADGTREAGPG